MHCPRCGNRPDAGQQFCRSCGLNLEKVAELLGEESVAPEATGGEIARLKELQRKHESWSAIAGLLTFGLILLLFIAIIFTLMILIGRVSILPGSILILFAIGAGVMGYFQSSAKLLKQKLAQSQLPTPAPSEIEGSASMPLGSITDRTTELLNERRD
jgi:uncharacterized integral membrane protein